MESVLMKIYEYYTGDDRDMLLRAYDFAREAHPQPEARVGRAVLHPPVRRRGDPGRSWAGRRDHRRGASARRHRGYLRHRGDVRENSAKSVLTLVAGVTKLDKIVFKSQEEEEAENFRKIFIAMAKDIRVIIIKLADRLHNMRSLNFLSKERQQKMARETLDIYAPIAGQAGYFAGQVRAGRSVPEIPRSRRVRVPRREHPSEVGGAQPLRRLRGRGDQRHSRGEPHPRRGVRPPQALLFHL